MKNIFQAVLKYLRTYPDSKLCFIYTLKSKDKYGSTIIVYTQDKKYVKRFKYNKAIVIKRKLMCRTLY